MKTRLPFLLTLMLGGCTTFDQAELAQMRTRGVPSPLVHRVEQGRSLRPEEVAALSRRGVPPERLARYIHRSGVRYLLTPDDARRLRRSGVATPVIDALVEEGEEFARDYGMERRRLTPGMTVGDPYLAYPDGNGFEW